MVDFKPRAVKTVKDIADYLEKTLKKDAELQNQIIEGTIVAIRNASSGHCYFKLGDDKSSAQISCTLFANRARYFRSCLVLEKKIILKGSISYYAPTGQISFLVQEMAEQGTSVLAMAKEALRAELKEAGYFAPERKRTLPRFPFHIGLVTSPEGAVRHDIQRIIEQKHPYAKIYLFGTPVQGEKAPAKIAAAIAKANREYPHLDALIVARGGGSQSELSAYDQREVLDAAFHSRIPVVSAIGHEQDCPLLDEVADLRAATPTHAADLVFPTGEAYRDAILDRYRMLVERMAQFYLSPAQNQLRYVAQTLTRQYLLTRLYQEGSRLDQNWLRFRQAVQQHCQNQSISLEQKKLKLESLSPQKLFQAGYFWIETKSQRLTNLAEVKSGETLFLRDGKIVIETKVEDIHEQGRQF